MRELLRELLFDFVKELLLDFDFLSDFFSDLVDLIEDVDSCRSDFVVEISLAIEVELALVSFDSTCMEVSGVCEAFDFKCV